MKVQVFSGISIKIFHREKCLGKITFEGSHISLAADLLDLLDLLDLRPSERICPIGRYFEPFNTTDLHRKVHKLITIVNLRKS